VYSGNQGTIKDRVTGASAKAAVYLPHHHAQRDPAKAQPGLGFNIRDQVTNG